ncbi:MAG: hypothetical protein QXF61_10495 [Nitrososphaeria archaeon]
MWLDREILPRIPEHYHIINLNIFNPPHSYHPNLKNPFFQLIGDTPDFAIAHIEQNVEYGKGLIGLYQYDRLIVILDIKHERGAHPKSTKNICARNCERFNECFNANEVRGWFPESQVEQIKKFYNILSSSRPDFGFVAWFPLPTLDKITEEVVDHNLVKWCYVCVVLGSDFLGKNHALFKILNKHMNWEIFNQNIRLIPLDQNGKPLFEEIIHVPSERGKYKNICFKLNKTMSKNEFINFLDDKVFKKNFSF